MDPSRKRRIRLVVALTAAVLLAGALVYTSFCASSPARPPSQLLASADSRAAPTSSRARSWTARSQQRGDATLLPRARPQRHRVGPRALHGRGARPVPRRAARSSSPCASRAPAFVGEQRLAGDEVPVEVHRQAGRRRPDAWPPSASACLILALASCAYGIGASLYGGAHRAARLGRLRRGARSTRWPAADDRAFAVLEVAFLRSDFRFDVVADALVDHDADLLQARPRRGPRRRARCCCGCGCCRCGRASCCSSTRRRMRDVAPYATAVLLGFGAFFAALLVFAVSPFDTLAPAPAEGAGLNPLLRHPSMMIHPPMLYSGYTLFTVPVRVRDRGAGRAARRRRVDPRDAPLRAGRLVLPRHRDPARRPLVLRRAGLGRLLGLGPGRERLAAAVADRHRVPALDDDPGEARDAEGLERLADPRHRHAGDPRARSSCARGSSTRSTPSAPRRSACPFVVAHRR